MGSKDLIVTFREGENKSLSDEYDEVMSHFPPPHLFLETERAVIVTGPHFHVLNSLYVGNIVSAQS